MGLVISKGLTLRKGYIGTDDPDAEAYIAAVEAADLAADPTAQPLETATKVAIHSFVKGAKADGFWPAIKASCILAGARTLSGALVPLVGAAPTNFNFVSGDYNRKTGLVGNGSTKYLDSNRNNKADPLTNHHVSVHVTDAGNTTTSRSLIASRPGGSTLDDFTDILFLADNRAVYRSRNNQGGPGIVQAPAGSTLGFHGVARAMDPSFFFYRRANATFQSLEAPVQPPVDANFFVFARNATPPISFANARLAFYSIGESLDLALLDARVTDLINAFGAAIP
jgi:hypothetical protein